MHEEIFRPNPNPNPTGLGVGNGAGGHIHTIPIKLRLKSPLMKFLYVMHPKSTRRNATYDSDLQAVPRHYSVSVRAPPLAPPVRCQAMGGA